MFRVQLPASTEAPSILALDALDKTHRSRWADCRGGGKGLRSQARIAVEGLATVRHLPPDSLVLAEVTSEDIATAVEAWRTQGLSPATITKRLNCLSAMGVSVAGQRPRKERALKWWLRPDQEARAVQWLDEQIAGYEIPRGTTREALKALRFVIRWTTKTGLRIEETLRLTPADFGYEYAEMTVPGLKTSMSQATLPLGSAAQEVLKEWLGSIEQKPRVPVISIGYAGLYEAWRVLAVAMEWPDKTATLKALRRSAARYLHTDMGMPLDMVRHYLRHESINTTMGYLRLTGGYGTNEMGRFLK